MTDVADGAEVVLSVTIVEAPPVAGSIALNVTGRSSFVDPQKPIDEQKMVAEIFPFGADCVVRVVVTPESARLGVTTVIVEEAGCQLPSETLAVRVTMPLLCAVMAKTVEGCC